ncbi:MAG: ATP-binding cassette domain-containing protein [Candidatus Bathyarchaeia archaeon]
MRVLEVDEAIIAGKNLKKTYGSIEALKGVSFELSKGEILGLAGDNGAGKSTLIKILRGVVAPSSGELWIEGRMVRFWSPEEANRVGIACVYQEYTLCDNLSVVENFFLGQELLRPLFGFLRVINRKEQKKRLQEFLAKHNFSLDIQKKVTALSGGQRRILTILRALYANPKVLLLDEPTAGLSVKAKETMFNVLKQLKSNVGMIIVLHSPEDVIRICDRILVLRLGEVSFYGDNCGLTPEQLIGYY